MNSEKQSGVFTSNKNSHGVPVTRVGLSLLLAAMVSACAWVPGQHMAMPPSLPVTTADNGDVTSDVPVTVKQIDLTLIRQIHAAEKNGTQATADLNLFAKPTAYKVGPGDVLQITVWDHPELAAALGQATANTRVADAAPGFVVGGDGNIQFPYISKPIHAVGKTPEQLQREIYTELSKVFVKPQVTVRVESYRASQVYVDGDVKTPGAQSINDIPMTLTEAVGRSGGFMPTADQSRVVITRNGTSYPVNVAQMLRAGKNPSDIVLQPGDMLHVSARDENTVYVMGEVVKPTAVTPLRDGTLTLAEAISQAGNLSPTTSNARQLFVIRQVPGDEPVIYHLDAKSPVSMLLANQFPLEAKDVVYVDNSGLVRASRVLDLLLPAINAGLTTAVLTK
ncbi:polysaccharide biosynthesis/export family protein [Caballeronia sordidicola]|jgi:polysaccharide biosynthesis/export protein|uniref:polysaccharide biosynthesis/export family protein n=1 Tax=Caballeronia sordidicola TaxID=196367 RepID=UPI0004CFF2C6